MSAAFAAAAAAAEASPQFTSTLPPITGRVLLVDGDALCYACAGNDDTPSYQARINVHDRIRRAKQGSQAETVRILTTARTSHKGHRYAIARVKPYQGQRSSGRRPKNWQYLRELLEAGIPEYSCELTTVAEADDLFAKYSHELGPENVVIHTQDKDMRMVPGWHLVWDTFGLTYLPPGKWEQSFEDKLYGQKWFWLQMLHGDTADNIPGLPKYINEKGNPALCGEKTAAKLLADCANRDEARVLVSSLYQGWYGEGWQAELLEQAVLLWMRREPGNVFDVCNPGGPLDVGSVFAQGKATIMARIAEAQACQPG